MRSVPPSAPSEPEGSSPTPLRDAQGRVCQDVTLPDPLDARSAADVFLNPGTCLLLHGRDGHRWTPEGCRTLAYRAAGRCPLIIDDLPEPFARAIEAQLMWVLDWIGQAA